MFTFILYSIFKDFDWRWKNSHLNLFGNILTSIASVIIFGSMIIIMGSVALVENIFIVPIWLIYNLVRKKEYKKSYLKFLRFEEDDEK